MTWTVLAAALLALMLAGCNSSSSPTDTGANDPPVAGNPPDDPPGDPTPEAPSDDLVFTEFSGTAMVPSGWLTPGTTGGPRVLRAVSGSATMSDHDNGTSGLSPVTGGTVELVLLADDGTAQEPPLASGQISETGTYTLAFPDGVEPGANVGVRFVAPNNDTLHAQVVSEDVLISPVSEYVIRKLVTERARLSLVSPSAVTRLSGVVEGFDFEYEGSSLQAVLDAMEEDEELNEAATASAREARPQGSDAIAQSLAGDWRLTSLTLSVGDTTWDDVRRGTVESGLDLSSLTFGAPDSGDPGELALVETGGTMTFWSFNDPVSASFSGVHFEFEAFDGDEEPFPAEVDADRTLYLFDEPRLEVFDGTAFLRPASTLRFLPAGDDVFVSVAPASELLFGATEGGAADPDDPRGRRVGSEIIVLTSQPQSGADALAAINSNTYGLVGFQPMAWSQGNLELLSHGGRIGPFGGADGQVAMEFWQMERDPNGAVSTRGDTWLTGAPNDGVASGSVTVSADGDGIEASFDVIFDGGESDQFALPGQISADGSLMVLSFAELEADGHDGDGPAEMASHGMMFGLRLGTPDLGGNTYELRALDAEFHEDGEIKLERTSKGRLTFRADGQTADVEGLGSRYAAREEGGPDVVTGAHPAEDLSGLPFTVAGDGHVTLQLDDTRLEGFASADGGLIILSRRYDTRPVGDRAELGMGLWIMTRVAD